jgi:DNA polymerase V
MYALCDGNGFYAACEKVFDPAIRNKPVVVLSNNDGCVVAACGITKKLGVNHKFKPYFQIKQELDNAGVIPRSSNYELYADLSQRMMLTCGKFAKDYYIYSIDECFLDFADLYSYSNTQQWLEIGHTIRRTVWKEVRLPIGVGIGTTPTLAKAANHASKRIAGYRGVAVINDENNRQYILSQMAVLDVWGIGRKLSFKLGALGIKTALQLSQANPAYIRRQFSILVENTVRELNGELRLSWDSHRPSKKEIYSTRSFGERVTCKEELRVSMVKHAETVARKLRVQQSLTKALSIFASSSPHDDAAYVSNHVVECIPVPSSDSRVLSQLVSLAVNKIFQPGVRYYKSGVGAIELSDANVVQRDLFANSQDNNDLMTCLDNINTRFGKGALHLAARGFHQRSAMKRNFLSPQYTTNWAHIPRVQCL